MRGHRLPHAKSVHCMHSAAPQRCAPNWPRTADARPEERQVDFIVLGIGLGALLLVASVILRDLVPRRLGVASDDLSWAVVRHRRRSARLALAAGRTAVIGGSLLLVVTGLLILLDAGNGLGWIITLVVSVVALAAAGGWTLWTRARDSSGVAARQAAHAAKARIDAEKAQRRLAEQMRSAASRSTLPDGEQGNHRPSAGHIRHQRAYRDANQSPMSRSAAANGRRRTAELDDPGRRPEQEDVDRRMTRRHERAMREPVDSSHQPERQPSTPRAGRTAFAGERGGEHRVVERGSSRDGARPRPQRPDGRRRYSSR